EEAAGHFKDGAGFYDAGRFAEAAREFEAAIAAGAKDPRVYYNLSCSLFRAGDVGRAVQNAEIAAALYPSDRDTRENLAYLRTQIVYRFNDPGADWALGAVDELTARVSPNILAILLLGCESMSVLLVWAAVRQRRQLGSAGVVAPLAAAAIGFTLLAGA